VVVVVVVSGGVLGVIVVRANSCSSAESLLLLLSVVVVVVGGGFLGVVLLIGTCMRIVSCACKGVLWANLSSSPGEGKDSRNCRIVSESSAWSESRLHKESSCTACIFM